MPPLFRDIWLAVMPTASMSGFFSFWKDISRDAFASAFSLTGLVETVSAIIGFALYEAALRRWPKLQSRPKLASKWMLLWVFLAWLVVQMFIIGPYKKFENKQIVTTGDLRMSVINYGYDKETHELYADVQYVNHGRTRRTVLGVTMCCRARGENGQRLLRNSYRPGFYDQGSPPTYVEPNQPIVQSYKFKLDDSLIKLTETPGEVFGLEVATINSDGSTNFNINTIEAMVVEQFEKSIAWISSSQNNISLDVSGYKPMQEPVITSPSPTPNREASPH